MTLDADWRSHHIEGYAVAAMEQGKDGHFSAPLISHIKDNLWVGGCIQGVQLDEDFKYVVSLYPWEKYLIYSGTERFEFKLFDSSDAVPDETIKNIIDIAAACVEDGKTLIHCQAGLNRSNMIAAGVLIKQGMEPADAIALLREKRSPMVLCNKTFEDYILNG